MLFPFKVHSDGIKGKSVLEDIVGFGSNLKFDSTFSWVIADTVAKHSSLDWGKQYANLKITK
jgi:hypothetical protein